MKKKINRILKGFTLLELMIVIIIVFILAGLLLPALSAAQEKSRQTRCLNNLRQIGLAIQMYAMENNGYYPSGDYTASFALPSVNAWNQDPSGFASTANYTAPGKGGSGGGGSGGGGGGGGGNPGGGKGKAKKGKKKKYKTVSMNTIAGTNLVTAFSRMSNSLSPASVWCSSAELTRRGTTWDWRNGGFTPQNVSYVYVHGKKESYSPDSGLVADVILADTNAPMAGDAPVLDFEADPSFNHKNTGVNVLQGDFHAEFMTVDSDGSWSSKRPGGFNIGKGLYPTNDLLGYVITEYEEEDI